MATTTAARLGTLFERDETAWLDAMSELIRQGRLDEIDRPNLSEYLADMARRDRREVTSRLSVLIAHLLKWTHQPGLRSASWRTTVEIQRQELLELLESATLRAHAIDILPRAYANGVRQAAAETGLLASRSPSTCPFSLDDVLTATDWLDPAPGSGVFE